VVPIPLRSLVAQGFYYLSNSLAWDPLTLTAMAALVIVGLRSWRVAREPAMLAFGVLFYLFYLVRIGGDYMSGRFLTAPLVVSLLVLSRIGFESLPELYTAMGLGLALGISAPRPPIMTRDDYVGLGSALQLVDDERGYRQGDTALLRQSRGLKLADRGAWVADGIKARREQTRVVVYPNIGYFGYFAGPLVHVIDPYGLGDPLMARMSFDPTRFWSAAHFYRTVPKGYLEAAIDEGVIENEALQAYWKKLELVTRGPIFSAARLVLVARFNLGLEPVPK
jgi:arabinofuranosyltransferase